MTSLLRKATLFSIGAVIATGVLSAPASARTPGAPVPQLGQVNQSSNGGDNASLGLVPATSTLGRPNAGVVPVVGTESAKADDGAYVAYESRLTSRTVDLMISSPALAGAAPVRVLLPSTWSSSPKRTYPVLLLLPGASEKADYQSWSLYTHVLSTTAAAQALVVMPSVGSTGIASNWTGVSRGYRYDTFLTSELPQLLTRGYRSSGRTAVAGASTGGYSAFALAALHPGTYRAAAAYSGLLNPSMPGVSQVIQALLLREGLSPWALWGDPYSFGFFTWLSHDPTVQASKLRGTALFASSGNGAPGPLDPPGAGFTPLDSTTLANSQAMVGQARVNGLSLTTDFYGAGTHSWRYWDREFTRSWPMLASALGV